MRQQPLLLEQAALRDKELHVVVQREVQQLPVNGLENDAFGRDDLVGSVPIADLVVERVGARVLDLEVFGGNQQAAKTDEESIILLVLRNFRRVQVHQVDCMVDGLAVRLECIGDERQVVDPLFTFL